MRMYFNRQKGFTLIELMIVILIIAILVAIAVPVFLSARANAQRRTCQANLRTIDGAINTYSADYEGLYPSAGAVSRLVPALIKRDPTCPSTGSAYTLAAGTPPTVECPTTVTGHTI
ncbi:MAG: prepilin-type N-terminal cleavage/methylation domain-containing protein [Candidatus Geothermincolia bacterium]